MNTQGLILILCGVAAVVFQCLVKLDGLLKDARAANVDFKWKKDYLQRDIVPISTAFLTVGIWYLVFGEVIASYPGVEAWSRISFVAVGGVGSWALQYFFGKAKDKIRDVIDRKTDKLDQLTGNDKKTKL